MTAAALTSLTAGSLGAWARLRGASESHGLPRHPAGLQVEFINPIFEFSRAMRRLGLDDAEYALLIAINIFSADRPNVQEPSRVEALQQPYVEALLSYTRIKRPQVAEPSPKSSPRPSGRHPGWGGVRGGAALWTHTRMGPASSPDPGCVRPSRSAPPPLVPL